MQLWSARYGQYGSIDAHSQSVSGDETYKLAALRRGARFRGIALEGKLVGCSVLPTTDAYLAKFLASDLWDFQSFVTSGRIGSRVCIYRFPMQGNPLPSLRIGCAAKTPRRDDGLAPSTPIPMLQPQ